MATIDSAVPFTPEEEAAERAYIEANVSDPLVRRWIATLDAERARASRTAPVGAIAGLTPDEGDHHVFPASA